MVEDTPKALDLGAVKTLIIWDNLEVNRYVLATNRQVKTVITCCRIKRETMNISVDVEMRNRRNH
jgi:hypothetical protein